MLERVRAAYDGVYVMVYTARNFPTDGSETLLGKLDTKHGEVLRHCKPQASFAFLQSQRTYENNQTDIENVIKRRNHPQ